ncbi:MAG: hypothetical protein Q7K35_02900 [bacterium]|nr:hypothetical protein [bacterium]
MKTNGISTIVHSFPDIKPINFVEEAIKLNGYASHYSFISNETVPLQPAHGEKRLHFVCFDRTIKLKQSEGILRAERMRLCKDAPNFLLGFAAQVPETRLPAEFRGKHLVAIVAERSRTFPSKNGDNRCFLYIDRSEACRRLGLVVVDDLLYDIWALVAEDLPPDSV